MENWKKWHQIHLLRCYQIDQYHTHGTQPVGEREEMEEEGDEEREERERGMGVAVTQSHAYLFKQIKIISVMVC